MLDGAARVKDVVQKAKEDGMPAIGITDHGNMYGALDFYKRCKELDIKPIIGTELYQAYDHRTERFMKSGREDDTGGETEDGQKAYYHLTALAETQEGYKNLIQLSSRAYLEGFYRKPKVDWDLLDRHSKGIIVTTGCLGGHVLQALLHDNDQMALEKAARLQEIFGRDNMFVELQDHGIPEQHITNPKLIKIAETLNAPLLLTNDSHYTNQSDAVSHDALLCVQTGSLISDEQRFKFHGDQHYLKTADEMRLLLPDYPSACDNTLWIAERADVEIKFGEYHLPKFEIPFGYKDDTDYLQHLTIDGATERWGTEVTDEIRERIAFELKVIADMGFSSYFLIVWDLIKYAKEKGIRVGPGRGSAAGSAVAYCLGITDLDPIKYDLLFERFLNPSRISMPDIDMDFDSRYRDELIRYTAEKYGKDKVAQIVTFSTIKARAAVRDAARVLGYPFNLGDQIAKAMPPLLMGRSTPLIDCIVENPDNKEGYENAAELREMYKSSKDTKEIIDVALGLEDLRRGDGIHAAAVVISDEPLMEYVPLQRKPKAKEDPEDAPIVTQYDMHGVEELGLLKMDYLGLKNLDIISDTIKMVKKTRGIDLDIDNPPLDDEVTLEMLREGNSIGVFQLEGVQMRNLMRRLAPTSFDDIAALVALYRPGPMGENMHNDYADRKNGRQSIEYLHEDAREILSDTYGLMIYQEELMRIAQKFAGYSLAEADTLRKACGKKIPAMIAAEEGKFIQGCIDQGYGRELGEKWFNIIKPFADYAFNKSHSYGYGFIAYQTAYLKANYTIEYLAALLTSTDKANIYLNECRRCGIPVHVPDINVSHKEFVAVVEDDKEYISFGLGGIKNLGEGAIDAIIKEREENGKFADFFDYCKRLDSSVLNKKFVESLILAGAFDSLGHSRQGLLASFENIIGGTSKTKKKEEEGQFTLFSLLDEELDTRVEIPDIDSDPKQMLAMEREVLGFYISDHPLNGVAHILDKTVEDDIFDLQEIRQGVEVSVGGLIKDFKKRWTKKGDAMATFAVEDLSGEINCVIFPRGFKQYESLLSDDAIVVLDARTDRRDESVQLIVNKVKKIDSFETSETLNLALAQDITPEELSEIKRILVDHPGNSKLMLHVGETVLVAPNRVSFDDTLVSDLRTLHKKHAKERKTNGTN